MVLDADGLRRLRALVAGAGRPGRGGPVTARAGSRPAACGGVSWAVPGGIWSGRRPSWSEACLAWGVWADGVRQLAERRLGVSAADGFAVLDDPDTRGRCGWARGSTRHRGGRGGAGGRRGGRCSLGVCPCLSAEEQ